MVGSDLFRLVLMALVGVWHDSAVGVYVIAFGMSLGMVFFNPAAGSVLPALIRKDTLVAANSGIWTAAVLSQVVLAPLAGLLVSAIGYGAAFGVNAVSYAVIAAVLRGLHVGAPAEQIPRRQLLTEARDGISVLVNHRLSGPWASARCWRHCRPAPPAPCWSCWPRSASGSPTPATAS